MQTSDAQDETMKWYRGKFGGGGGGGREKVDDSLSFLQVIQD